MLHLAQMKFRSHGGVYSTVIWRRIHSRVRVLRRVHDEHSGIMSQTRGSVRLLSWRNGKFDKLVSSCRCSGGQVRWLAGGPNRHPDSEYSSSSKRGEYGKGKSKSTEGDAFSNEMSEKAPFVDDEEGAEADEAVYGTRSIFDFVGRMIHVSPEAMVEFEDSMVDAGKALSKKSANRLAHSLFEWASGKGAINFAMWSIPQGGMRSVCQYTSFLGPDRSQPAPNNPRTLMRTMLLSPVSGLDGSDLFQKVLLHQGSGRKNLYGGEGSTSYMTWDKGGHPFVFNRTLFIPAAIVDDNGHALDEKTPLLRSQTNLGKSGSMLLKLLGDARSTDVLCQTHWEQDFYLAEREVFVCRQDLVSTGRALFGKPNGLRKYSGGMMESSNIKEALDLCQEQLLKIGISVAFHESGAGPSQFRLSSLPQICSNAIDSNVIATMLTQEFVNSRLLMALFHEKPFAGLEGSSKVCSWGLNTLPSSRNLLVPGRSKPEQRCFVSILSCILRAFSEHGDLILGGSSTAGNDLRLDDDNHFQNSVMVNLGEELRSHFRRIATGDGSQELHGIEKSLGKCFPLGASVVQPIWTSQTLGKADSPVEFTGDKFLFRTPGSQRSLAFMLTLLNSAVAESMDIMSQRISQGESLEAVVADFLKSSLHVFDKNDLSGICSEQNDSRWDVPSSIDAFESMKHVSMLKAMGTYNDQEIESQRAAVANDYLETITDEVRSAIDMLETGVLPAAASDLKIYAGTSLGGDREESYQSLRTAINELGVVRRELQDENRELRTRLDYAKKEALPVLKKACAIANDCEGLVSKQNWPFPSLHQLLINHHSGRM